MTFRSMFDEAIKIFREEKAASDQSDQRREEREERNSAAQVGATDWAKRSFWVSLAQLPVGVFTLLYLIKTFKETRTTAQAGIAAAKAAAQSAEIAGKTLNEIKRTSERELRAYIGFSVNGFKFLRGTNNAIHCEASYTITNYGQTPAHDIRVDSDFRIAPFPLTADFKEPSKNVVDFKSVANPGQAHTGVIRKGQALDGVTDGDKIYLFGVIRYRDVFGAQRETWFCGCGEESDILFSRQNEVVSRTVPFTFKLADRHNEAT